MLFLLARLLATIACVDGNWHGNVDAQYDSTMAITSLVPHGGNDANLEKR